MTLANATTPKSAGVNKREVNTNTRELIRMGTIMVMPDHTTPCTASLERFSAFFAGRMVIGEIGPLSCERQHQMLP